jgi:hypothetical protein
VSFWRSPDESGRRRISGGVPATLVSLPEPVSAVVPHSIVIPEKSRPNRDAEAIPSPLSLRVPTYRDEAISTSCAVAGNQPNAIYLSANLIVGMALHPGKQVAQQEIR